MAPEITCVRGDITGVASRRRGGARRGDDAPARRRARRHADGALQARGRQGRPAYRHGRRGRRRHGDRCAVRPERLAGRRPSGTAPGPDGARPAPVGAAHHRVAHRTHRGRARPHGAVQRGVHRRGVHPRPHPPRDAPARQLDLGVQPQLFTDHDGRSPSDVGIPRGRGRTPDPADYPSILAIPADAQARRPGAVGCDEDFEMEFAVDVLIGGIERLRADGWQSPSG